MPTLLENQRHWENYDWSLKGEEWSQPWGNAENMWWGTILPRIRSFIPAATVLELAPGCGRITQYLKDYADTLLLVDLAKNCIDTCKERFASQKHIQYFVNDGTSLDMLEDESIDFVFSFASLIHAEMDVLEAYLKQLAKKLKPDGVGFLHH